VSELIFDEKHDAVNKHAYWTAVLSDGRKVFEDCRKGLPSAWIRLKQFLKDNPTIKISELFLTFGGQRVRISKNHPHDFDGFYFSNRIEAVLGGIQKMSKCIGLIKGPAAHVIWICQDGVKKEESLSYDPKDPRVILDV